MASGLTFSNPSHFSLFPKVTQFLKFNLSSILDSLWAFLNVLYLNHVPRHTHIMDNIVHFHLIHITGLCMLMGVGGGGPEALSPGLLQLGSKLINLVPRLKMSEPIPLLPNYAFVVCTGPTTPLPLLLQLHNMNKYWWNSFTVGKK